MNPKDIVYLKHANGSWFQYEFIKAFDWNDAVQITNGVGVMTCKASELITKEAYDKMVYDKRKAELEQELAQVIKLYGAGPELQTTYGRTKHTRHIAKALSATPASVGQKIACAKRWGLIK